ncbi:putative enzymatic polyprotein, partial [Dictyocoela muelleri]
MCRHWKILKLELRRQNDISIEYWVILTTLNLLFHFISHETLFISSKLKKNERISWEEEDSQKFKKIMEVIKKKIILKYPDPNKEFILETDASDNATGAVLKQGRDI